MADTRTVRAGRRSLTVHRPDKVLFPADGNGKEYTKGDLVAYYRAVAPFMVPHLRGRPLMLERHPDGIDGPRFMQKNVPEHYPDWIERVEVAKEDGTVTHLVCDDTATLVYLADQACVTPHRWLSRAARNTGPTAWSSTSTRRPGTTSPPYAKPPCNCGSCSMNCGCRPRR